jgi:hypothetical protein
MSEDWSLQSPVPHQNPNKMAKFIVSRTAYYEESVEIEAQTREEAIKIAQTTGKLDWNSQFLETDHYEAEEE